MIEGRGQRYEMKNSFTITQEGHKGEELQTPNRVFFRHQLGVKMQARDALT